MQSLRERDREPILRDYDRLGADATQGKWQARGYSRQQVAGVKAVATRTTPRPPRPRATAPTPTKKVTARDREQILRDYNRLGANATQAKWQARGYRKFQIAGVKAAAGRNGNGH